MLSLCFHPTLQNDENAESHRIFKHLNLYPVSLQGFHTSQHSSAADDFTAKRSSTTEEELTGEI